MGDARRTRLMTTPKLGSLNQARKILEIFADTPNEQLQAIFASGLLTDLRDGDIEQVDREEFRRVLGLKPPVPPLLDIIGTHLVPATTAPFVAKEKFTLKKDGGICSYLHPDFSSWFLGKTEDAKGETTLRSARLTKDSLDKAILAELGTLAETTLTEMFTMMEAQADGKEGDLLTNGYANIFYIKDITGTGTLRAVRARWADDGWGVVAFSVEYPRRWGGGRRIFSRNS